jgi:Sensors of blue-light using FAD
VHDGCRHQLTLEVSVKRLIYCSQASHDFSPDELIALLAIARRNNESKGLSGMLLYCSQSFLQMLEGEPAELAAAFARISADDRHSGLRLLLDADVPGPMFPDWSMGFDHVDDEEMADELEGYTPATQYPLMNPDLITNAGVAQTLLTLYAKNKVT